MYNNICKYFLLILISAILIGCNANLKRESDYSIGEIFKESTSENLESNNIIVNSDQNAEIREILDYLPSSVQGEWKLTDAIDAYNVGSNEVEIYTNNKIVITEDEISYNNNVLNDPCLDYLEGFDYNRLIGVRRMKPYNLEIEEDELAIVFSIGSKGEDNGFSILYSNGKMFFLAPSFAYRMVRVD